MVNLVPFFRFYQFTHGIRMLKKGYTAARDSLEAEIKGTQAKAAAYQEHLANGGERICEYDADGYLLWEQSQVYDIEIEDARKAIFEIRKALVIALYHHWEHSAASWKGSDASHGKLAEFCIEEGYGPSPDLSAVQYLVNYLKHGSNSRTDWLKRLRNEYPCFLTQLPGNELRLSEVDLDRVAAAIEATGPSSPAIIVEKQ
ncbi:hypothetical protein [Nitratireductor sp.]|uniref:hypothetical protein n=1 Tax=Nitratireductor sp. TaxID=1872084 RepID=UPI0025EA5533|nr:hypothetical protein [Nitratireductor sp.]